MSEQHPPVDPSKFSEWLRLLREAMPHTEVDLPPFLASHKHHPFISANPLYALNPALLASARTELSNWLTPDELAFEAALVDLCQRHGCIGFFHGRPIKSFLVSRPPTPVVDAAMFTELGWGIHTTLQAANMNMSTACDRLDPLQVQTAAYVGWLLTYPLFLAERDAMRLRWTDAIQQLESFPRWPVMPSSGPSEPKDRKREAPDQVDTFAGEWNALLGCWELQTMATWDLPEPHGCNLSGLALPSSVAQSPNRITLELSAIARMAGSFSLAQLQEEIQRHQTPPHLQPWLDVLNQQHGAGLRFQRLGHLFELVFYRDTVLASRYSARFRKNVERLDQCFATAWNQDIESVKKLRLQIEKLRSPPAEAAVC